MTPLRPRTSEGPHSRPAGLALWLLIVTVTGCSSDLLVRPPQLSGVSGVTIDGNTDLRPLSKDGIATNGREAGLWFDGGRLVRFAVTDAHFLAHIDGKTHRRLFDCMDRVSLCFDVTDQGMSGVLRLPRDSRLLLRVPSVLASITIDARELPLADFISEPTQGCLRLALPAGRHAVALTYQGADPDVLSGWPLSLKYSYLSSPAITDLDGDGAAEVVLGCGRAKHNLLVIRPDGSFVPGWPQSTPNEIAGSPAIGDLDGDGQPEIVVGSFGQFDGKERLYRGLVHAWHGDGRLVTGWPVRAGWGIESSPALADLDGDTKLEVIIGSTDRRVYALRGDGSPLTGWPRETGGIVTSSPAVGDLDADGVLDVVVGSGDGKVYVWSADGRPKAGWPFETGLSIDSSPALADLDGDGRLDVVVGSNDGSVYAFSGLGRPLPGWPQRTGDIVRSSPAVGDLDGDGRLEVVAGSYDRKVYVWHADGRLARGWPRRTGRLIKSSPILADLDGDGRPEVVIGAHDSRVWAWHADGTPAAGWPKTTLLLNMATPVAGDLDSDGCVEILTAAFNIYHGKIFCWECPGKWDPQASPWPMFRGNLRRTGVYGERVP